MAQLLPIKMSKFDNQPWGFRFQGGIDFAAPLTVQKVNGGSLAEKAGLCVGDNLIRVNSTDIYQMRHKEAQDTISRAGNNFALVVSRGTLKPKVTSGPLPLPVSHVPAHTEVVAISQMASVPQNEAPQQRLVNKQFNSPIGLYSEETIAEMLSSQAEVLAQGVLGVNFKKNEKTYDPSNSEVFKMLQEMALQPKEAEPGIDIDPADASPAQKGLLGRDTQSRAFRRLQETVDGPSKAPAAAAPAARPNVSPLPNKTTASPGFSSVGVVPPAGGVRIFPPASEQSSTLTGLRQSSAVKAPPTVSSNVNPAPFQARNGYYKVNEKLYYAKQMGNAPPPAPNVAPVTIKPGAPVPRGGMTAQAAAQRLGAPFAALSTCSGGPPPGGVVLFPLTTARGPQPFTRFAK